MSDPSFVYNGLDATTGGYLLPDQSPGAISTIARGHKLDDAQLRELRALRRFHSTMILGSPEDEDEEDAKLSQTGWGVIFPFAKQARVPEYKEALSGLLERRAQQAGERFKIFEGPCAYRPGESKTDFLGRQGVGPGPPNPDKVPSHLLLVGGPEDIPFQFQFQLSVQYAVGRLDLDSVAELKSYAASVVAAEEQAFVRERSLSFFAPRNPDDQATGSSADHLVAPLVDALRKELRQGRNASAASWAIEHLDGPAANKRSLLERLGGSRTPALLFTAGHGAGFPLGHAQQLERQGALVTSDWPGPIAWRNKALLEDHTVSAADIGDGIDLRGSLLFFFACYGVGTPELDSFVSAAFGRPMRISPAAFTARLSKRLLGRSRAPLAVIGHVDRACNTSFSWRSQPQLQVFQRTIVDLLRGKRVGTAFKHFSLRYAELATVLSDRLQEINQGTAPLDELNLAMLWTFHQDARGYLVLGDPAVRLRSPDPGK